jgi:hypothetical protein
MAGGSSTGALTCDPFRRALLLVERVERRVFALPEDEASFFFFFALPLFEDDLSDPVVGFSTSEASVSALRLRDEPLWVLRWFCKDEDGAAASAFSFVFFSPWALLRSLVDFFDGEFTYGSS